MKGRTMKSNKSVYVVPALIVAGLAALYQSLSLTSFVAFAATSVAIWVILAVAIWRQWFAIPGSFAWAVRPLTVIAVLVGAWLGGALAVAGSLALLVATLHALALKSGWAAILFEMEAIVLSIALVAAAVISVAVAL
jgi:hypothetical protein